MAEQQSPLGEAYRPGRHGNLSGGHGVTLSHPRPGSIVEVACWPGQEKPMLSALRQVTGLGVQATPGAGACKGARAAFGTAPGRMLVIDEAEGLAETLAGAITSDIGTTTDLSHGRSALRIEGPSAQWVLAKLFALDFSQPAFPVGTGKSTAQHDIFAAIQRRGAETFDIYVYRSFARAFWTGLRHAAEEVGYEVR